MCQRKGIFLNLGRNITLTHLEISGAEISADDGGNGAAIRDQGLGGLNLRYVYFHDNQNGILSGNGVIHIDWSKFERNEGAAHAGFTHNTYFSADVTDVVIRNSLFLRAANQGNNMKSRAQRFEFFCSVSASLDGVDSREMDISEGGELVITNSIIQQGPESANSNMIGFATEAGNPNRRHTLQKVNIHNTDFLNDRNNGAFLSYSAFNDVELDLSNIQFVGPGPTLNRTNDGQEAVTETNLETFDDQATAGLPAYSTDHFQLPLPRGCPDFEYF
ncbi:MAG: hypothetical protein GY822_24820 [Deltaproteobacteria bacterium]|nr:hypothetical protein [Deltaproteobacteria bacterium]